MKCGLDKKELRDPDGGIHLARKKAELGILEQHTPDTSSFPTTGFSEALQSLPYITFKTVWTYMVTCVNAKKQLSTAKPLVKGFTFYESGHVLTIKSCNSENNSKSYVQSQVLPSMKKTSAYLCQIVIRKNGLIQKACCGCPAGVDGRCNHVAATLFALEEFCKARAKEENEESCTSQKCQWNVPRKRKVELVPISKLKFRKHEYGKVKNSRPPVISPEQDVRPPKHQTVNTNLNTKLYNIYSKVIDFQENNTKVIGLSHILQQNTTDNIKAAVSLDHDYCKLLSNGNDESSNTVQVPNQLTHDDKELNSDFNLISPIKVHPVSLPELKSRCQAAINKLHVTEEEVSNIELQTRKQSQCSKWFWHRKYRITASKSYRCASMKESTSPRKAVEEVLGYKKFKPTYAMNAGLTQEPVITKEYIKEKEKNGENVVVEECTIILIETDIPGAVLPQESPELCSVVQLKRWLLCRGACTTGRKVELVSRLVDESTSQ